MSLLVFGKTGQVAQELAKRVPNSCFLDRDAANFDDPVACSQALRLTKPTGVIIAAAWTAVDAAEDNRQAAFRVNAETPGAIALTAAEMKIPLVHISTDYVFDGTGNSARKPEEATSPLGVYGASKLAGEDAVRQANGVHCILRTSWVFSSHGNNFVKTMLRLSETNDALRVVDDQVGGPTHAGDIAAACLTIMEALVRDPGTAGTYHFCGAPDTNWAMFARAIFEEASREVVVTGIPSSAYPTPAARPLNSTLDCTLTMDVFGIDRPNWRAGLRETLTELGVPTR